MIFFLSQGGLQPFMRSRGVFIGSFKYIPNRPKSEHLHCGFDCLNNEDLASPTSPFALQVLIFDRSPFKDDLTLDIVSRCHKIQKVTLSPSLEIKYLQCGFVPVPRF